MDLLFFTCRSSGVQSSQLTGLWWIEKPYNSPPQLPSRKVQYRDPCESRHPHCRAGLAPSASSALHWPWRDEGHEAMGQPPGMGHDKSPGFCSRPCCAGAPKDGSCLHHCSSFLCWSWPEPPNSSAKLTWLLTDRQVPWLGWPFLPSRAGRGLADAVLWQQQPHLFFPVTAELEIDG